MLQIGIQRDVDIGRIALISLLQTRLQSTLRSKVARKAESMHARVLFCLLPDDFPRTICAAIIDKERLPVVRSQLTLLLLNEKGNVVLFIVAGDNENELDGRTLFHNVFPGKLCECIVF